MSFYAKAGATAKKLLVKYGKAVVLIRSTGGSFDPVAGVNVAGVDASVTTTGIIKPYPDSVIDGKRILSGDRELVLSNEHQPLADDRVTIGGENWTIVNIKTVIPDDATAVVYFCQVRK